MKTLSKGATGSEVQTLQHTLNTFGYKLAVDGVFGQATHDAVTAFQRARGLAVDGIVGPATWNALCTVQNNQLYQALVTCLDAIEDLPEYKTLTNMLGVR